MKKLNIDYGGIYDLSGYILDELPPLGSAELRSVRALVVPPLGDQFRKLQDLVENRGVQAALFLISEIQSVACHPTGASLIRAKRDVGKVRFDFRGNPPIKDFELRQKTIDLVLQAESGVEMLSSPSSLSFSVHTPRSAPAPLKFYAEAARTLMKTASPRDLEILAYGFLDILVLDESVVEVRRQLDRRSP